MSFSIDKQSLDELNLMGKFRQGSVYALFNKVKTRIGEKQLDAMFAHPMTDPVAINRRTASFRFFQQAKLRFTFEAAQVAVMREYSDMKTDRSAIASVLDLHGKKLLSSLTKDEKYKSVIVSLQATIVTLKKCREFIDVLLPMQSPIQQEVEALAQLLAIPEISKIADADIYGAMTVSTAAQYDYIIRNKYNDEIRQFVQFVAELDVYIAVSEVARELNLNYAEALPVDENTLQAVSLRHPCISGAVGNDLLMSETSNVIFLTGANMAGKSTWMKSIGIGLYLAHIGFPVAADSMRFSVREGLYSSINVADNIGLGYSHFYAEVVRVKQAAEAAASGRHLLLMFDELFKGTNVKDAYDGTLAVTEAFAEYHNCLFIVSTHIIEVGEALGAASPIQFKYLPTVMDGVIPRYTYRLEEGITEDRQGMMIIRNEGILELIQNDD